MITGMNTKSSGPSISRSTSFWMYIALALLAAQAAWAQQKPASTPSNNTGGTTSQAQTDRSFVIGPDDVLGIDVWKEPEVSRVVTVRSDGKISLPLIGELQAEGKTPKQLEDEIRTKLASFIADPEVTLIVQEVRSRKFNVLGQVQHPGSYVLTSSTTVLDAIALAGGFRDFAKQKAIYVLRKNADGSETRIPFNYQEVIKGDAQKQNVKLANHDTVVVP